MSHISVDISESMAIGMPLNKRIASSLSKQIWYSVFQDIWLNQKPPFTKGPVLCNDPQNRINVRVPETTSSFSDLPSVTMQILERLGVCPFIHREYEAALHDILEAKKTGDPIITVGADSQTEHADLTQPEPTISMKCIHEEDLVEDRAQKREYTDKVSSEHVVDPHYHTNTEALLEQYINLFQEEEAKAWLWGFIVLGHTGIDKEPHASLAFI
ncbi:uncharacterized protein BT62DRAFT_1004915 [Guyanagaster necrorhizus]|uniref:Uncharacterized protein n=1 Tax=Guyanagaster necrorhizus TaxID=856835 RepID=A0A9P7VTR6_9AGAR|nr:uncharacterized protein BT62DRAFT_1004915 [Guyanagaster necrorhizus MCA 3950]KAG7447316.1 hypothetical protein BT62DRAFT_1004915 [Guyanagaster necrorhizus MCA 3950]